MSTVFIHIDFKSFGQKDYNPAESFAVSRSFHQP